MTSAKIHPPSESTAIFIRSRLLEFGKDYPYSLWRKWKAHLEAKGFRPPTYASFRKFLYACRRAGLIRHTSPPERQPPEVGGLTPMRRRYHELVPEEVNNREKWRNPQVAVWGEKMRFGRDKYRRKVLGIPAKPVGRPPKQKKKYAI